MGKIKIVTDSTCDISKEEARDLQIHIIPLSITIDGETYLDRVDISPKAFLEKMKASVELPKSSQPAVGEFVELYNRLAEDGSDIISIHMTGRMSGTVEAARTAAAMANANVTVIDSLFISKALAYQVRKAALMAKEEQETAQIVAEITDIKEKSRLFVVVDTLENLVKGGRIGKGKAMIGSLLNIKPIAMLEAGEYSPVAKVRSHSQGVKYLAKQFIEDIKGKTLKSVSIVHADGLDFALKLKNEIQGAAHPVSVEVDDTTPVISTHTGPGAIGFMYWAE
ncbi:MAG TPA: DegV family protein [Bacillaceae bacterium]